MERTAHVGADVDAAAVLQVAERLLEEGRSRLESSPESALVALQQAFSLEQQFGTDGERLCRACSSVCHALSRIAHPQPPVAAVEPLVQGLETLDKMRARRDAGAAIVVLDEHAQFLARELLGLARQLARVGGTATTSAATLAEVHRPSALEPCTVHLSARSTCSGRRLDVPSPCPVDHLRARAPRSETVRLSVCAVARRGQGLRRDARGHQGETRARRASPFRRALPFPSAGDERPNQLSGAVRRAAHR